MVDFVTADMDEFIASCAFRFCPECGKKIDYDPHNLGAGRPKTFCSNTCRQRFWKAHPKMEAWSCFQKQVCPVCGQEFYAQHENKRKRKYCSRACANRGRARKGETDDGA